MIQLLGVVLLVTQFIVRIGPAPIVTITTPTSAATYDAGASATLTTLAGTASVSNGTVTSCSWTNNQGGSGTATGAATWSVPSIPLVVGQNFVTVICVSALGASSADAVTVTRSAGGGAPADWFVATTGNNGNLCTAIGSPCLTLAGVHGKAIAAGDIIQVAAGTYAGTTISKSGTSGNPITWRGHSSSCPTTVPSMAVQLGVDVQALWDNHSRGVRPAPTVTLTSGLSISGDWVTVECFRSTSGGYDLTTAASQSQITDSTIDCASGNCGTVEVFGASNSFLRNFLYQPGGGGNAIFLIGSDHTVSFNEIERVNGASGDNDYVLFGDIFGTNVLTDNVVFEGNYFWGNRIADLPGAHSDGWQTFCQSGDCPITNILFTRNTVFHFDECLIQSNDSGNGANHQGWTFTNNICAWPRMGGGGQGGGGFGSVSNLTVYHNTFHEALMGCGRAGDPASSNVFIRNNVYSGGNFTVSSPCTATKTNNIESPTNPLLVDPANGDFTLQAGSPAISAGMTGLGVTVDRNNASRDGAPDAGAYEFGAGGGGTDPIVTITSPTSDPTYDTAAATTALSGTASDDETVASVTWINDQGGSGTATGTTSWSISSVALTADVVNAVTTTVTDNDTNTGTDVLQILRVTVPGSPTDAFTRPTWATLGANWTNQTALLLTTASNQALASAAGGRHCAFWNAHSFTANHFSQVVIVGTPTASRINYVTVRAQGTTDATYDHYHVTAEGTDSIISKVIDGVRTPLQTITSVPWAPSDTLRLEAVGDTLRAYRNGSQIGTDQAAGGELTAGSAGACGYGSATFDTFTGGGL